MEKKKGRKRAATHSRVDLFEASPRMCPSLVDISRRADSKGGYGSKGEEKGEGRIRRRERKGWFSR